ncbi:hypothetical protein EV421DRAFT_1738017 [Armillaria borealis]|uniref:Fungal N-terminal domain-containing protein n=1 Tax=Armillaria borealis TaxID=47425 RepID=A0AA39MLX2_9AGAR|nr:hypothetical protein EV421DRAFT_1738017 [Armillaria borealis]
MAETATWLTTLKILSIAGEMAHFPYIGGVATCVITLLETIQAAAQNDEDLQELMKSTKDTTEIVTETVTAHEDSAPHFRHVCEELENYLKGVLPEMEKMHLKRNRGLKRFFRVKNISVAIAGFKQRVQKVKEDFMIRVMTDSRFAIADLEDRLTGLEDKLTGLEDKLIASTVAMNAIGTSQRDIQKEMRAVGTLQNERMDAILSSIIIQLQARSSCEELAGDLPS